jgi:hypothetical protein
MKKIIHCQKKVEELIEEGENQNIGMIGKLPEKNIVQI